MIMDEIVEIIKEEVVLLSLINKVEIVYNGKTCYVYIDNDNLFSLYSRDQVYYTMITDKDLISGSSDAMVFHIKDVIEQKTAGKI